MLLWLGLLSMLGIEPRWHGNWRQHHPRHNSPRRFQRRRGTVEAEKNFRQSVFGMVLEWGLRASILALFVVGALSLEFEVFGVEVTLVRMIRFRSCAVQWTGENACHLWCGWISYHELSRMIGGLLELRQVRRERSCAGQSSGFSCW